MKTLSIKSLIFAVIASLTFMTSCKKEDDLVNVENPQANIVGEWNVDGAHIMVYSDGYLVMDEATNASGTMTFKNDNTGSSDFSVSVMDETEDVNESFTWKDEGFEILMDEGTEDEIRWVQQTDEINRQVLSYTMKEDGIEVEFTLNLSRK